MLKFIEVFIDSVIAGISVYTIGKLLFNQQKNNNIVKIVLSILIYSLLLSMLNYFDFEIYRGIFKILCVYILFCLLYKYIFEKSMNKVLIGALILYLCMSVAEVITVIISSFILEMFGNSIKLMKNNIILNLIIQTINVSIVIIFKSRFQNIIKNSNFKVKSTFLIIPTMLIALSLLLFKIPLENWNLNAEFYVTMSILLCFCIIGLYLIKQKSDIEKTSSMYQQLAEYSQMTSKVLEEYRIVNHEHKNQLSIIRQMSDNKNKKLNEYLDNLLEKKNDIKYKWVSELNNIPLDGLKGLINYKLIEIEENKINASINISKEIKNTKLNKLKNSKKDNLYSIIGIYLDNAIDASIESKEKEISIEIFKEKSDIIFVIGNTYKGNINLDKLDESGYSTKGKNHGIGLHIVRKILEEDNMFTQERKILDNYFIQELRIKLDNKK